MRRLGLILVTVLAIVVGLAVCAFQEAAYPPTLCDALILLGTAAAVSILLGAFISVLLEYWSAWEALAPKLKRPVVFGFCLVLPLITLIGRWALCGALIDQDTVYMAIMAGMAAFTGSQFAHIAKLPSK